MEGQKQEGSIKKPAKIFHIPYMRFFFNEDLLGEIVNWLHF